jgi:hypothetical protein
MGHAVDELGQDESRVARRVADATEGLNQAEGRLHELAQPLLAAVHELGVVPGGRLAMSSALAERLRQIGGQASLWLEAEAQLPTLRARVLAAEREREDLSFQVAQLKGRLGIISAEAEGELALLRQAVEELETELSRALLAIQSAAEPVVRALSAVPSVRDALSTGRSAVAGQGAASRG